MGRDQVHAVSLKLVIQAIAVIGPIANEMSGLGLQHVEVEAELDQGDFMMIGRMRADREGEPMSIHNREDFHAFAAFRDAHGVPAALGRRKRGIDETLAFIDRAFVAQRVRQLGQHLAQDFLLTPLLESAMDGFVIGIALGQEVPLRPRCSKSRGPRPRQHESGSVYDPDDCPECALRGNGPGFDPIDRRAIAACRDL